MSRSFKTMGFFAVSLGAILTACSDSGSGNAPSEDPPFFAVTRAREVKSPGVSSAALSLRSVPGADSSTTFYLAISKKALHQKWFLSAFLKQYFPGAVANGAARTLGTRVVTFRERNGKVYVFDASDNYANSDAFDPALMFEAYPIVSADAAFQERYVVVDPAAGQHRFGVTDAERGTTSTPFKVDLAYSQNFRPLDDGATFEEIFTGSSASPLPRVDLEANPASPDAQLDRDAFRASGTLGLSFRRYAESPSFRSMTPPDADHFFLGDTHLERDSGATTKRVAHWAIHPGMKPLRWVLSSEFSKAQQAYPGYDFIGAVQRGITNWNQAFGFEALTAELAKEGASLDDDTNALYFDADPRLGYAFANWRTNPNTGEIRGASIYFNAGFLAAADPAGGSSNRAITQWAGFRARGLCSMPMHVPAVASMTKKEQVEAYITHVILHEVGHTLGLRHNFKGSLVPPSTSVMDYLSDGDSVRMTSPGAYDRDALAYLYGMHANASLPAQPFCTDDHVSTVPDCASFDTSEDPLGKDAGPKYQAELTAYLTGSSGDLPDATLNKVAKWLRALPPSDAAAQTRLQTQKVQAWEILLDPLRAGVTRGATRERLEAAWRHILQRLYIDAPELRDPQVFATHDPPTDDLLSPKIALEASVALVAAQDTALRRVAVVVLKKLQTEDAHSKLLAARATLESQRGAGNPKLDDLLARIDQATRPYYD